MILSRLKEYADTQMNLPPEMYAEARIRWLINLKLDGGIDGLFTPLGGSAREERRGQMMVVPHLSRSSGIAPKLLADNGEYVLGIARAESKTKRVEACHGQFVALTHHCAEETQQPEVQAVVQFLADWDAGQYREQVPIDFDPADSITFRVGDVIVADARAGLENVQQFWAKHTAGDSTEDPERPLMTCLVTGKLGPVEERLPVKIKGIPDGQTSGTALVSANAAPFSSYGLKNSLTSPISRDAAERFAKALNHLISQKKSRIYLPPIVYVFWTREAINFHPSIIDEPDPQAVKDLFDSAYSAQQVYEMEANQFYALGLSASGGRAVVRNWLETPVPEVLMSLKAWFEGQAIVSEYGELGRYFGINRLASCVYRDAKKEMTSAIPTTLISAALSKRRLPEDMLVRLLRRIRVEQGITHPRAALIKLILTTQDVPMTAMEQLNLNPAFTDQSDRTAYFCGQLLAELEAVQRAALGQLNATIVDRYYGAASTTPAQVLGSLVRNAQAHLSKLRKDKRTTYNALQIRLEEILSELIEFPITLTLRQQSLFALGYYHQRAENRRAAIAQNQKNEQRTSR